MNERIMEQLKEEQERGDKLLDKFLVLASVQGRLKGVIKHHKNDVLVEFAAELLDVIEDELEVLKTEHSVLYN